MSSSHPFSHIRQVVEQAFLDGQCSAAALKALRLNRLARLARLLKLIRLTRLARWGRLITKAKDALSINPGHLRLVQFVLLVFMLAHVLSCILYGMTDWEDDFALNWATEVSVVVPGDDSYVLKCPPIKDDPDNPELVATDSPTRLKEVFRWGRLINIPECKQWNENGEPYYLLEGPPLVCPFDCPAMLQLSWHEDRVPY